MENFKDFKLESEKMEKLKAGRKVYNGTSINCDTGQTESVWDVYGIFGNYKGQHVESDQFKQ